MQSSYPRELAVRVLTRVLSEGQALDRALDELTSPKGEPSQTGLSRDARAWLQEVCSGTIRWKGRLDLAIDATALKKKPTGWLRKQLLITAYQLIAQDRIAPGAVVSETVDVVRKKEGEAPAKFTNAVLRKIADHRAEWRSMPCPTDAKSTPGWASLPDWMWFRLLKARGADWTRAYALASLERPVTWLRAVDPEKPLTGCTPGPWPGAWRLEETHDYASGLAFAQDISNQLLVREVAERVRHGLATEAGPLRALDFCAAPGGKSLGLALEGFAVTATDRDSARADLMSSSFARLAPALARAGHVPPVRADRDDLGSGYDLVWVDAPCTGSGILRRHPDVRWLKREADLDSLGKIQSELLNDAWPLVRTGGYLAYTVCSVMPQEGAERIRPFCESVRSERVTEWDLAPQSPPNGDGFYGVLLRRL